MSASIWGQGLTLGQVGAILHAGYGDVVGQSVSTVSLNGSSATGAAAADTLYLYPFPWFGGRAIQALFGRVMSGGTTSNAKFGLWANASPKGRPTGLPLASNNTGAATTTPATISQAVTPVMPAAGVLWVGVVQDGAPTAGWQAVIPSGFDRSSLFPVDAYSVLLRGAANNGLHGISTPLTYASDIGATDLTGATWTMVGGNAGIIPIVDIGF